MKSKSRPKATRPSAVPPQGKDAQAGRRQAEAEPSAIADDDTPELADGSEDPGAVLTLPDQADKPKG